MTSSTLPTVTLSLDLLSMSSGFRLLVRPTNSQSVRADGMCQTVWGEGIKCGVNAGQHQHGHGWSQVNMEEPRLSAVGKMLHLVWGGEGPQGTFSDCNSINWYVEQFFWNQNPLQGMLNPRSIDSSAEFLTLWSEWSPRMCISNKLPAAAG